MDTPEGCASYTDVSKGISYYSNGEKLWNSMNSTVLTGFLGDRNATQSAILMQKPQDKDTLYLFTLDNDAGPDGLRYSVIVNGNVVSAMKNISLKTNLTERMCLVQHCNNEDAWLIVHGWNENKFYSYKITGEGIDTVPVVSVCGSTHSGMILNATGYMKASLLGDKIALAKMGAGTVELFNFDNTSGNVYGAITINNLPTAYGVEFNETGTRLYVSTASGSLYNFNISTMDTGEILNSKSLVYSSSNLIGALQIGPDKRIYVAQDNSYYLGMISAPDNLGTACAYNPQAIYLEGHKCESGLPPYFPLKPGFQAVSGVVCEGDTTYFGLLGDLHRIDSVAWDFGDPTTNNDYSDSIVSSYVYPASGFYNTQVLVYHCDQTDTFTVITQVAGKPQVNLGNDTSLCTGESITLGVTPAVGVSYLWEDGSASFQHKADKKGVYWLQASSVCGTTVDSFEVLNIWPVPNPVLPSDTTICKGDSILIDAGDYPLILWNDQPVNRFLSIRTAGNYSLEVIDTNNCKGYNSFELAIKEKPRSSLCADTNICYGSYLRLEPGKADNYLWQNQSRSPFLYVSQEGSYWVRMTNECGETSDTVFVSVDDCDMRIIIPNAFTPNGDNINDVFKPVVQNVVDFVMYIYNKEGSKVFETHDPNRGWNGRINGPGGEMLASDSYFYYIRYRGQSGKLQMRKGFVTMVR